MKVIISFQFRELAAKFRQRAAQVRDGKPLATSASEYATDWALNERAGLAIIGAFDAGLLDLAGLSAIVKWFRSKSGALKGWPADMARIPQSVLSLVAAVTRFDDRPRGLLAGAMPEIFPPAQHKHAIDFHRAHPGKGEPGDFSELHRELGAIQQEEIARSLEVLARMVDSAVAADWTTPIPKDEIRAALDLSKNRFIKWMEEHAVALDQTYKTVRVNLNAIPATQAAMIRNRIGATKKILA